ncbi:MAG: CapA family protein [candidate division WOR-3 bacterium]
MVGDILLARGINRKMIQSGVDYPFKGITDFITDFDLAFCNLECPISVRGKKVEKPYCFRADTVSFYGLKNAGFNIFSLANNHTLDWGEEALLDTRDIIEQNGLYAVGAGKDQTRAIKPVVINRNGLKIAFLASIGIPFPKITRKNRPGPAQAELEDIMVEVNRIRDSVDFVVLSLHWGNEYQSEPTREQIKWAHKLIDQGVDMIIGHHPHCLQSIEVYKGRIILYSLGNFIFDQRKLYQRQSGIFSCIFRKGQIDSARFIPVILKNFQPNIAQGEEFKLIEKKIVRISKKYRLQVIAGGETLFLADSTGKLTFPTPIKYNRFGGQKIIVYRNLIELFDSVGRRIDSLRIEQKELADGCFVKDSNMLYFLALTGPGQELNLFTIDNERITERGINWEKPAQVRKIVTTDLENDSILEICIGADEIGRTDLTFVSRFFIYNIKEHQLSLKWSGVISAQPLIDFDFFDVDGDGSKELICLELAFDGTKTINAYQWWGSGFLYSRMLAPNVSGAFLDDAKLDSILK